MQTVRNSRSSRRFMTMSICLSTAAFSFAIAVAQAQEGQLAQSTSGASGGSVSVPPPGQSDVRSVTIPVEKMDTEILGFRSAKFGQSEADVRAAIVKDLHVKPSAIHLIESVTEKTRALVVRAPDVIPVQGSGTAEVSYVLGHSSGQLIQVSLVWSKETDPKLTPDQLVANAALLNEYFRAKAAVPSDDRGLVPLSDGRFLLFRGEDAEKHTVMLIARGPLRANSDGSRSVMIDTLWLYYVQNFDNPDVFRLPPGSF